MQNTEDKLETYLPSGFTVEGFPVLTFPWWVPQDRLSYQARWGYLGSYGYLKLQFREGDRVVPPFVKRELGTWGRSLVHLVILYRVQVAVADVFRSVCV